MYGGNQLRLESLQDYWRCGTLRCSSYIVLTRTAVVLFVIDAFFLFAVVAESVLFGSWRRQCARRRKGTPLHVADRYGQNYVSSNRCKLTSFPKSPSRWCFVVSPKQNIKVWEPLRLPSPTIETLLCKATLRIPTGFCSALLCSSLFCELLDLYTTTSTKKERRLN